jgi:hypothetical protein
MKNLKVLLLVICCLIPKLLFAQTATSVKVELSRLFNKIEYWGEHQYDTTSTLNLFDSVPVANKRFKYKLEYYTKKYPFIFDQNFNSIKGLKVLKSSDNILKVYSWDDETGGTMRNYVSVIQFKSGNKLYSSLNDGFFINIYTLKVDNQTYYLLQSFGQGMSSYFEQTIEVWTIDKGHLNMKVKLFKTETGLKNSIGYAYWFDGKHKGDIEYNQKSKTIYFPLTTPKEKLTNKYIAYQFTGQYFEKVK